MTSLRIVLEGFLRHTITMIGVWLVARGYLSPEQQVSWMQTAITESMGGVMIALAYLWSAVDKQRVVDWILHAVGLSPTTTPHKAAVLIDSKLVKGGTPTSSGGGE